MRFRKRSCVLIIPWMLASLQLHAQDISTTSGKSIVPLSSLDLTLMQQSWGKPQIDRSMRETSMSIAGQNFTSGVGTHAESTFWINFGAGAERFQAMVGLDDGAKGAGSVRFLVIGDNRKLFDSGIMRPGTKPRKVDVSLSGIKALLLKVDSGDDGHQFDHADWADANFIVHGEKPRAVALPDEERIVLTPKPGPAPRINSAAVYGCRPGNPFLYRIPCSGTRPVTFAAQHLPPTLQLDASSGIIGGIAPAAGHHSISITASNKEGSTSRTLEIVSGDTLSLTPYMGWNHWYAHYDRVSDALVRRAADAMVASGMADAGYSYVCIDDCWMNAPRHADSKRVGPLRDEQGNILCNTYFPNMNALTDYIHGKGLKTGIYTSPGPLTCGGFCGSYQHEAQDASQFAKWGFDLLKYDLCSYGKIVPEPTLEEMKKPYELMGRIIKEQKRDILFNLCQYGIHDVWKWGEEVHGHSWRTAGDLGFELNRIFDVAARNATFRAWNGPGHWNDPDYIQIGYIGNARTGGEPSPCPLTPSEQYSFMSLWCLSAAPLMFSGDMDKLDDFTLNILCNPEVIAVNQDPLGQCATLTNLGDECFLLVKHMSDGSNAVGLCNGSETPAKLTAHWNVMGIQGKHSVRDLWRHKDLEPCTDQFTAEVPRHGVSFVRIARHP
ncbi:MAG: NPCBM/NEW2 domain-containing protein [Candidatus Sumerlaeaceae bacterium]